MKRTRRGNCDIYFELFIFHNYLPRYRCRFTGYSFFHKEGDTHACNIFILTFNIYFDTLLFMKLPTNKSLHGLTKSLRNNGTMAEAVLWRYLKNKNAFGYNFHRQKNIGNYIVDFYCPKLHLVRGRWQFTRQ